ncbi:MAG: endolytic transglycosylase MltG [Propionibacteriaceae bacterium]|jgi:UPF0755 protein|nr:endolytic transglycosylase MltG [Propionibacteriaceae bacterium]
MRSGSATPSQRIKSALAVLVSLAVLGGAAAFVGFKGYAWYTDWRQSDDYIGDGDANITVTIPSGSSLTRVGDILESKEVIRDSSTFLKAIEEKQKETEEEIQIQSGSYKLMTHWPAATALEHMLDPKNLIVIMVTVQEGKRWTDVKTELIDKSGFSEHDFNVAAAQPELIGLPAYAENNVEGFLFPDTYALPPSASEILKMMTTQFDAVAADLNLEGRAAELGLSPRDVVKVASIIEAEVSNDEDRPKVARAIYNRLALGMRLQTDSTLIYGLGKSGYLGITVSELADESNPYNLYQHDGLPPTPIDNPGRAALSAALNPADGDWLYWVTVNLDSGETRFAATGEEHEANVALLNQWCAEHPEMGC